MAKILPEAVSRFHKEYIDPVLESVVPKYKPRTASYKVGPYASGYVSHKDLQLLPEPGPERLQEWSALPPRTAQDKTRDFVRNLIMKAGPGYDTAANISRYIVGDINAPLTQGGIGALDFTPAGLVFSGQSLQQDLKEIDRELDEGRIPSPASAILPIIELGLSGVEATGLGLPMAIAMKKTLKNPAVKEFAKNLLEKLKPTELRGSLSQLSQLNRLNIVPDGPKGALAELPPRPREVDPEGFYSVVQEAISLIKRGKGTGQEFVDEMRSQAVKQGYPVKSFNNEIKAMGLNLDSEFTKEEFAQHLNDKRFTVDVVENKSSGLPVGSHNQRGEGLLFNEIETVAFEDLPVGHRDFFEEEIKTERRDFIRDSLEIDLSGGYSLSPELDREAAFNKAAILKAFDENKTEFIDVDGYTQDFEDKIDSIAYDIARENYEDPSQAYQRVPVVIDGDEQFTLFRGGEDDQWQLREGDGMLSENLLRRSDGEAIVSEDNLAEAQIQTSMYLQDEGLVSFEGMDDGLQHMHEYALTDQVNVQGTQPNRREILITSPEVGDFKDHFTWTDDTVVSSVMASDWDGPIATTRGDLPASNKVLYGDEIQSDLSMANSRWGQRTKIIETDVFPLLDDLRYFSDELENFRSNKLGSMANLEKRINRFITTNNLDITHVIGGISRLVKDFDKPMTPLDVSNSVNILTDHIRSVEYFFGDLDKVFSKNPRLNSILYGENRLSDNLASAREKLNQIRGPETNVPNPWQDTWHELALKKLMKTAVDEGYDYVMVPKSETLVAKWGAGMVEGREGAYRKMYQTVYDRKIPSFLKKYAKQYNSELIDAELGASGVMAAPETTLIKITPEMKEAAKEGQPLFNITVGTTAGAGALSTLDQEEQVD